MPLDGLRAWIGEVERKLGMRTRVFLVLATIAIGGAGAAIYLALDTREDAVSESDVQELQERLEGRVGFGGATAGADVTQLQAEIDALEADVEALEGDGAAEGKDGAAAGSGGTGTGGDSPAAGGTSPGIGTDVAPGAPESEAGVPPGTGADAGSSARLKELLEQAKKQNERAEQAQGETDGQ